MPPFFRRLLKRFFPPPVEIIPIKAGSGTWLVGGARSGKTRCTKASLAAFAKKNRMVVLVVTDHPHEWDEVRSDESRVIVGDVDTRFGHSNYDTCVMDIVSRHALSLPDGWLPVLVLEGTEYCTGGVDRTLSELPDEWVRGAHIIVHSQHVLEQHQAILKHCETIKVFRCAISSTIELLRSWFPELQLVDPWRIHDLPSGTAISVNASV